MWAVTTRSSNSSSSTVEDYEVRNQRIQRMDNSLPGESEWPYPNAIAHRRTEPRLQARWQLSDIYKFERPAEGPVYAIDTPPATVSGKLHMGHVYSYSHADFMARFWRMNGRRVFYPMGYDDNGLPTERLVEKTPGNKRIGTRPSGVYRKMHVPR